MASEVFVLIVLKLRTNTDENYQKHNKETKLYKWEQLLGWKTYMLCK